MDDVDRAGRRPPIILSRQSCEVRRRPAAGHNAEVEANELPDRYAGVEARIPETWDELQGPADGVIHLPNRLAWSGLTDFDISDPGDRFALFCILLDCGQRADIGRYVMPWSRAQTIASARVSTPSL